MSDLVRMVRAEVPNECVARRFAKDGCSIRMTGVPTEHVTIDVDCNALPLRVDEKRCDFVFVGEDDSGAWVAPIELKSGSFSASSVAAQLQVGADLAHRWLPANARFQFAPVVAHRRGIRREKVKALQRTSVTLREQKRRPKLIHCGSPLRQALA